MCNVRANLRPLLQSWIALPIVSNDCIWAKLGGPDSEVIKWSALNFHIVTKCYNSHKISGISFISHVANKIWIWREGVR